MNLEGACTCSSLHKDWNICRGIRREEYLPVLLLYLHKIGPSVLVYTLLVNYAYKKEAKKVDQKI